MGHANLVEALQRMYYSDDYSDLTIKCGTRTFKLHKAIVCPQSEFLQNSVKDGRFKEGETGVIEMHGDDPDAIQALKEFMYTGNYTIPNGSDADTDTSIDAMHFHLKIYELADKTFTEKLKLFAEQSFRATAQENWSAPSLAAAARMVYQITTQGSRGKGIRDVIIDLAAKHMHVIVQPDDSKNPFKLIMDELPELGSDVAVALATKHPLGSTVARLCCPKCKLAWELDEVMTHNVYACPSGNCSNTTIVEPTAMKKFSCKEANCNFAFKTSAWRGQTIFWCPLCDKIKPVWQWKDAEP